MAGCFWTNPEHGRERSAMIIRNRTYQSLCFLKLFEPSNELGGPHLMQATAPACRRGRRLQEDFEPLADCQPSPHTSLDPRTLFSFFETISVTISLHSLKSCLAWAIQSSCDNKSSTAMSDELLSGDRGTGRTCVVNEPARLGTTPSRTMLRNLLCRLNEEIMVAENPRESGLVIARQIRVPVCRLLRTEYCVVPIGLFLRIVLDVLRLPFDPLAPICDTPGQQVGLGRGTPDSPSSSL